MPYRTSPETQKRKDAHKELILRCAAGLFAKNGYARTTMRDIVAESGLSTGTFYFYFKNKQELFLLLYDEMKRLLDSVSDFVLEDSTLSVSEGFCRSKTGELWAFQKFSGLARAMMVEAAGMDPVFSSKRAELLEACNQRIEKIFSLLKLRGLLAIDDVRTAVLLCNGTMYYMILDWLERGCEGLLMDYAVPLSIFNLSAFGLSHTEASVRSAVQKATAELDENFPIESFKILSC